jgi:hypothetical protein
MLMEKAQITDYDKAKEILLTHGNVKQAVVYLQKNTER